MAHRLAQTEAQASHNRIAVLLDDIRAIFKNDPAARNLAEVLLYPGLHALLLYRIAHELWQAGVPFIPRLISQIARFLTGIEIHPGAKIGRGFFIDHGMGVVIGETTEIGDRVMLYQGVTLGGTGKQRGKRHPTLEDDVIIGVGASVLGDIRVGHGARVGGGAVVMKDVPPYSTAVGVPARIVAARDPHTGETRRVEHLPDPEAEILRGLRSQILQLDERLGELEDATDHHHQHHHLRDTIPAQFWTSLEDDDTTTYEFTQGEGI